MAFSIFNMRRKSAVHSKLFLLVYISYSFVLVVCSCLNFARNSLSVCRTKLVPICNASRRSVSMETVSSRGLKRRFEEVDSGSPCSTPKDSDDDISSSDSADSCDSLNAPSSSLTRKNAQVSLMTSLL